ncbi:hypothetical protein AE621_26510 [Acidovorax sp. SD340]|nr:hypothetical protein AE621_26510 [Acidovorax sp. SD340]
MEQIKPQPQRAYYSRQDDGSHFVLQMIYGVKRLPMTLHSQSMALEDQIYAIGIGGNGYQGKTKLGVEDRVCCGGSQQHCTCSQNHDEGGYFNENIHALVKCRKNQFLVTTLTQQRAFKKGFGKNTTEPKTDKREMKW